MAADADFDPSDLVVEPHHLTPQESAELEQYIKEHREKHPLTEQRKQEIQALLERLRAASRETGHSE